MTIATLQSWDQTIKDHYPLPGQRIKQYVVDWRREDDWERETCPLFNVDPHDDTTDSPCCNVSHGTRWTDLAHVSCDVCDGLYYELASDPRIASWLAVKAARPLIEPDRSKLSDEIAPPLPALRFHPATGMIKR